jgi:MFS family permease
MGLLLSTGLSQLGNAVVAVVLPWLVLQRTGSASWAGIVAAASLGPTVLSALLGGALVDRWGRRRSSVGADLLSALAVAAIPLADVTVGLPMPLLAALVAAGAVFDGPGGAAREALRPDAARASGWSLERINARGEAVDGAAATVGPAAAGLLIAAVGPVATLWVTVVMFGLAAAITSLAVRVPGATAASSGQQHGQQMDGRSDGYWLAVRVGLRFVWRDRTLRAVALVAMLLLAVVVPVEAVVLPVHLQEGDSAGGLAVVLAGFAVGGVAGSLAYGRFAGSVRRRRLLLASMAGLGIGLAALAALPPLPGLTAVAALTGFASGPIGPIVAVLMQERTPEELRGRVIGAITSAALAAAPAALLVAGPLVDLIGVPATLLVLGAGCLLATAFAGRAPGLRSIEAVPESPSEPDPSVPTAAGQSRLGARE